MFRFSRFISVLFGALACVAHAQEVDGKVEEPSSPREWYGQGVRPTEPRSPLDEMKGFHLPKGFVVELVASEPQIAKPMNIAMDARNRLWVTQTVEYPYPAKDPKRARDQIRILEDEDRNGTFEKVTVFAEGLNIPIGLLPYRDGCLCFSIPNILFLRDTDGDGKSDQQQVILGPFDTTRDTHGMVNSLRLGRDGWIYANHGYNNQSNVAGKDGHSLSMTSGNTFRFRPDGSRVELVTQGQVNPFGSCEDHWGIRYTADCHSVPITQLLSGGCYPSFGRPDDGLGFAPSAMEHLHGSTAIAGLALGDQSHFPESYRMNFFSGNVMTSRINRDRIERLGSTVHAIELPDFLTSDDPWFRPVDLIFGNDGALYVADFYNKIIGHYEVPLDHPGRDRERGRIFRIRSVGEEDRPLQPPLLQRGLESDETALFALASPRISVQSAAIDRLVLRLSEMGSLGQATERSRLLAKLQEMWIEVGPKSPFARIGAMWTLVRSLDEMPKGWQEILPQADPLLRNHLALAASSLKGKVDMAPFRTFFEQSDRTTEDSIALRAIVEAIGLHGAAKDIRPLMTLSLRSRDSDPVLSHACKIACRKLLRNEETRKGLFASWNRSNSAPSPDGSSIDEQSPEADALVTVLLGLGKDLPLDALMAWASSKKDPELLRSALPKIAMVAPLEKAPMILEMLDRIYGANPEEHSNLLMQVALGQTQNNGRYAPELLEAASHVAQTWLEKLTADNRLDSPIRSWHEVGGRTNRPWPIQLRGVEGETSMEPFYSSFGNSEEYIGHWQTSEFSAPERLSFLLVGHNGHPRNESHSKNRVQLIDSRTQRVLLEAFPPRSDRGTRIEWDLRPWYGQRVCLRCIDGDSGTAFAWIGIGSLSLSEFNPNEERKALEQLLKLGNLLPFSNPPQKWTEWIEKKKLDEGYRLRMMAILAKRNRPLAAELLERIGLAGWGPAFEKSDPQGWKLAIDSREWPSHLESSLVKFVAGLANTHQQSELVKALGSKREWHSILAECVEQGKLGGDSLAVLGDPWWNSLGEGEVADRLRKWKPADAGKVIAKVKAIEFRIGSLQNLVPDPSQGGTIFKEKCSQCHLLSGVGKVLGPQLEGVGGRGISRLAEDILLPNRNVDEAFRMSTLLLDDGSVKTGWVRQRTESTVSVADQKGEIMTFPTSQIDKEQKSQLSLMPENFSEVLSDQELMHLIGYLQSQTK